MVVDANFFLAVAAILTYPFSKKRVRGSRHDELVYSDCRPRGSLVTILESWIKVRTKRCGGLIANFRLAVEY